MTDDEFRERLSRLEHGQMTLSGEVGTLRGEVHTLRDEVGVLRTGQLALSSEVGNLRGDVGTLRGEVHALRGEVTDIKSMLSHLMPMMIRIDEKLAAMPSAAEFYELRGRVEEISRRQPTTLGYTPPPGRSAQGG